MIDRDVELDLVGVFKGADKSSFSGQSFRGDARGWDYLRHYEAILAKYCDTAFNLIEIGVQTGVSLAIWRWFFPKAQIIGVDIDTRCRVHAGERTVVEIGSQDDPAFLARLAAEYPPTIVIDDGSHRADHIIFTFERLFPALLDGGVYIVEDLSWHFGENAGRWRGGSPIACTDYFLELAKSCLAKSLQGDANSAIQRYLAASIDRVTFLGAAVAIGKKPVKRDMAKALHFADTYLANHPGEAGALQRYAGYLVHHGGPIERAAAAARQAVELSGQQPECVRSYCSVLLAQGQIKEAVAAARNASETHRTNAEIWRILGSVLRRTNDMDGAEAALRRAEALEPNDYQTQLDLSTLLERQGRIPAALEAAQRGVEVAANQREKAVLGKRVAALQQRLSVAAAPA